MRTFNFRFEKHLIFHLIFTEAARSGSDESAERVHTAVGATLTQGVMIATITVAASVHHYVLSNLYSNFWLLTQ